MNYKPPQNDITQGEESREGDAGGRGVHTVKAHILNHTSLKKPFLLRNRNEDQWQRASTQLRVMRGGRRNSPVCEPPLLGEVERRDGGTRAATAVGSTKSDSKPLHSGRLQEQKSASAAHQVTTGEHPGRLHPQGRQGGCVTWIRPPGRPGFSPKGVTAEGCS